MTTLMTMEHAGGGGTSVDVANYSRRWLILAVLGIAQLMVILDSTIVNIALPTAQHDLHFSNADRQWIVTAYRRVTSDGSLCEPGFDHSLWSINHRISEVRSNHRSVESPRCDGARTRTDRRPTAGPGDVRGIH
jgi:hypothetical protein